MPRRRKTSSTPNDQLPEARTEARPSATPRWGDLVDSAIKIDDVEHMAWRLRDELDLGDERVSYGSVLEAADRSARNFHDARRLAAAVRVEEERDSADVESRMEVLRTSARKKLEEEKVQGSGPITKQRVEDKMRQLWPSEYADLVQQTTRFKEARHVIENLVDAWNHRCATLRVMLDRAASARNRGDAT